MDISDNNFGEIRDRLFEILEESGMSQKEFAMRMQVSPQTVTDWKKGKSASFLKMGSTISMVLNVSPKWLVFGVGEKYLSKQDSFQLLKEQLTYELNLIQDATEDLVKAVPELSHLSFLAKIVACAYDKADEGTQAAVRKLLDVEAVPQESGHTKEAM